MSKANILIVEDEVVVAKDIQMRLTQLGYNNPAIASSGDEAIEKCRSWKPDLVLMDIVLNRGSLDGIGTAEKIKQTLDIPIIYLTASTDERTLLRAKMTAPDAYVVKPFQTRELQISIEMSLYKHAMLRELREKERWLSTTLRSIGEGVITVNERTEVLFINPVAQTITGVTEGEALGKPIERVLKMVGKQSRQNPWTISANEMLNLRKADAVPTHGIIISRQGATTRVFTTTWPVMDTGGKKLGSVIMIRNLSNGPEV